MKPATAVLLSIGGLIAAVGFLNQPTVALDNDAYIDGLVADHEASLDSGVDADALEVEDLYGPDAVTLAGYITAFTSPNLGTVHHIGGSSTTFTVPMVDAATADILNYTVSCIVQMPAGKQPAAEQCDIEFKNGTGYDLADFIMSPDPELFVLAGF